MGLHSYLSRHSRNFKGLNTNRKIVVIESDDWGSIRMPSREVFDHLENKGYPVAQCPYSRNDTLASEKDLELLFDTLLQFRDKNGNRPVITANTVVTNPDFDKIRESGFHEYFYEPFVVTLQRYPEHQNSFSLWGKGIEEGIFFPQFHGREHVNVKLWMKELRIPGSPMRDYFDCRCWGNVATTDKRINIQAAFDTHDPSIVEYHKAVIQDGLHLFEKCFDYGSKSFIANNFIYHSDLNSALLMDGVEYIQGMKYQKHPLLNGDKRKMIRHYTGERNKLGQYYLVRNCVFEPSQKPESFDNVGECIKDIQNAFFWKKPAIITAHRLNFIGFIRPDNRDKNLRLFKQLLSEILKRWPDVEFMTSVDLGNYIKTQSEISVN